MPATTSLGRPDLLLRAAVSGASFPSGHALASTVMYGLVAYTIVRRWPGHATLLGAIAALVVAAIAFSRLYPGVRRAADRGSGIAGAAIVERPFLHKSSKSDACVRASPKD